ncbi:hypothetical protein BDR05DRAFT_955855 [Suillus weaverae]|nr:hypothetical protein BDR05DRAFT_955855 [Suillus weaverae]
MQKTEVRELAMKRNLPTATRQESMGPWTPGRKVHGTLCMHVGVLSSCFLPALYAHSPAALPQYDLSAFLDVLHLPAHQLDWSIHEAREGWSCIDAELVLDVLRDVFRHVDSMILWLC